MEAVCGWVWIFSGIAHYKMCMDCIARQKHESALEGSCSDVVDCDVELH